MLTEKLFEEPECSSDEEDPFVDDDTCSKFEIDKAFPVKYTIGDQSAVSRKKVYVLSICADRSFGRIATGLSNNSVQIFDITSNKYLNRPIKDSIALGGNDFVCGVRYLDEVENCLLIGSTRGDVGVYDLRTGKLEITFEDTSEEIKKPITSFDLNANRRVLCMGTSQVLDNVYLVFFDLRQRWLRGGYWESHKDDVTDVKFHPTNPDLMCSGSADGLINIFDISQSSEYDALTTTINTESSVHRLNWHKNVYDKDLISCITHMNSFKSYDCDEGDLVVEFSRAQVTEAIKRKSVADCNLISCHNTADGGVFLVAGSNFDRGAIIRSVKLENKSLVPFGDFNGNKQIIRDSVYDPVSNLLATAGEDGILTLWSPQTQVQPAPLQTGSSKFKAEKTKSRKARVNPY